jgi:NAD(P)-dependent dehydrogenase (short-subunit alcohol dehydrogenase family)
MILERFKVTNKIAIVTGGTRGIGLSIAHALGEAGAKLVITSRTDKFGGLESLKKANYDVSFFESDITDKKVPQKIIDFTLDKYGSIDILVNNAGVGQHGDTEDFNDELLDKIMNVNVDSVFRMCRSVLTPMKKQGGGVILNIGSISGLVSNIPQPQIAYNASKAAVHMLTKSMASDFADQNIRVNAIAPGYIKTEMTNLPKENEHWYPIWKKMTPLNRMGETDEIGSAALFLCSPASSYITGEVLVVDGGYITR